jgi:signal transduction histidine kinase
VSGFENDPAMLRNEARLAKALAYARSAMVPLVALPLFGRPQRRRLAFGLLAAAVAESTWFMRRVQKKGTLQDPVLIWTDVAFCSMFNIAVAYVDPGERRKVRTAVVSYSLASAGLVGFGADTSPAGALAVGTLVSSWVATAPPRDLKLVSDVLGHVLWYGTTILCGREFRALALQSAQAHRRAAELQADAAERAREADVAREREITHREIHEHLLPIVDAVASGGAPSDGVVRLAAREADRARRLLMDGRLDARPGFEAVIADIRDTFIDAGLQIAATLRIVVDPPDEIGDALSTATREALTNAAKYAGERRDVTLFVESTEAGVEIVVRDRGAGFDPETVVAGGGLDVTYGAVRRRGGTVDLQSRPGTGTKVTLRWQPRE